MQKIDLRILEGKDFNSVFLFGLQLKSQSLEGKINAHTIFSTLIDKIEKLNIHEEKHTIGKIKQEIWNIEKTFGWNSKFHSQAGQDKLIFENFFKNKKDGFYVDLGAYDGVIGSNTLFFEQNLNWSGILVEPSKNQYSKLKSTRNSKCINKAVSDENGLLEFIEVTSGLTMMSGLNQPSFEKTLDIVKSDLNSSIEKYNVEVQTFDQLIENSDIDYLSIDIEGGELNVLKNIDYKQYKIKVISIENNNPKDISYDEHLQQNGYKFFGFCGNDQIFYNQSLLN